MKFFSEYPYLSHHISTGATPKDAVPVPEKYAEFPFPVYTAVEIKKTCFNPGDRFQQRWYDRSGKDSGRRGLVDFAAFARNILADYG
jgi:hypothetical protein